MVSRDRYLEEVEKINGKDDPELRTKVDKVYEMYSRIQHLNIEEKEKAHTLVREILEKVFKAPFSQSYSIPIEFIESDLGEILFSLKFGISQREYTASEITAIMNVTRSLISYDKKHSGIKATTRGKNTFMHESELIKYMKSKGMDPSEIKDRLDMFKKLNSEGEKLEDIKEKIKSHIEEKYTIKKH